MSTVMYAEWVEDCWHSNYGDNIISAISAISAPTDGSAWNTDCNPESRAVEREGSLQSVMILEPSVRRGGGWRSTSDAHALRSANRTFETTSSRVNDTGFRVARTVPTPQIAAFQNDNFILVRGDDELAMVEVPVTINVDPDTDPITMELRLDTGGESVVSTTPSGTITFPPATAGNTSATFTLVAKDGGETTLTIVVTDGLGNTTEKENKH